MEYHRKYIDFLIEIHNQKERQKQELEKELKILKKEIEEEMKDCIIINLK